MFVSLEDFEDWQEEQMIREFENEFTHRLDFLQWEDELLTSCSSLLPGASWPSG